MRISEKKTPQACTWLPKKSWNLGFWWKRVGHGEHVFSYVFSIKWINSLIIFRSFIYLFWFNFFFTIISVLSILLSLIFLNRDNHLRYLKVMNDFSKGLHLVLCWFTYVYLPSGNLGIPDALLFVEFQYFLH
jgi:hypothetical protein